VGVDQLRHDLLPNPGLAEDQDLGFGPGGGLYVSTKFDEGRAFAKQQG
jgi:hypothetical protein